MHRLLSFTSCFPVSPLNPTRGRRTPPVTMKTSIQRGNCQPQIWSKMRFDRMEILRIIPWSEKSGPKQMNLGCQSTFSTYQELEGTQLKPFVQHSWPLKGCYLQQYGGQTDILFRSLMPITGRSNFLISLKRAMTISFTVPSFALHKNVGKKVGL